MPSSSPAPSAPTDRSARRRAVVALALAGVAAAATTTLVPLSASADPGAHDRDGAGRSVAELRRALASYQDVTRAVADGFVPTDVCAASPEGGMGLHYVKPGPLATSTTGRRTSCCTAQLPTASASCSERSGWSLTPTRT